MLGRSNMSQQGFSTQCPHRAFSLEDSNHLTVARTATPQICTNSVRLRIPHMEWNWSCWEPWVARPGAHSGAEDWCHSHCHLMSSDPAAQRGHCSGRAGGAVLLSGPGVGRGAGALGQLAPSLWRWREWADSCPEEAPVWAEREFRVHRVGQSPGLQQELQGTVATSQQNIKLARFRYLSNYYF